MTKYNTITLKKSKDGSAQLWFTAERSGGWESGGTYMNLYVIDGYIVLTTIMDKPVKVLKDETELRQYILEKTNCVLTVE